MKKRVKLFTTIASLCLAVALMAFGVYAATTANFTISGTVSFTAANEVYLKYTSVEYKQGDVLNTTKKSDVETATTLAGTVSNDGKWTTVDGNNAPLNTVPDGSITALKYDFKTANQNEGTAVYAYKVVVTFTAVNDMKNLNIALTDVGANNVNYVTEVLHNGEDVEGLAFTDTTKTTGVTIAEVDKDATITVTVLVSLIDPAVGVGTAGEGLPVSTAIVFSIDE